MEPYHVLFLGCFSVFSYLVGHQTAVLLRLRNVFLLGATSFRFPYLFVSQFNSGTDLKLPVGQTKSQPLCGVFTSNTLTLSQLNSVVALCARTTCV